MKLTLETRQVPPADADRSSADDSLEIWESLSWKCQIFFLTLVMMLVGILAIFSESIWGGGITINFLVIVGWILVGISTVVLGRYLLLWWSETPLLRLTKAGLTFRDYPEFGTIAWKFIKGASLHNQQYRTHPLLSPKYAPMLRIDVRDYDSYYNRLGLWNKYLSQIGVSERAVIISLNSAIEDVQKSVILINERVEPRSVELGGDGPAGNRGK
jgi:hypothetical protein